MILRTSFSCQVAVSSATINTVRSSCETSPAVVFDSDGLTDPCHVDDSLTELLTGNPDDPVALFGRGPDLRFADCKAEYSLMNTRRTTVIRGHLVNKNS